MKKKKINKKNTHQRLRILYIFAALANTQIYVYNIYMYNVHEYTR